MEYKTWQLTLRNRAIVRVFWRVYMWDDRSDAFLNRSWLENRCWRACGDECTGVFKKDLIKESQPCLQSVSLQIYVMSAHLAHK